MHAGRQLADRTEIMKAQPTIGQNEDVPRMRVRMEDALLEDLSQKDAHERLRQGARVLARAVRRIGSLTGAVLHREHATGGGVPENPGHVHERFVAVELREALGIARFLLEVQLAPQRDGELVHQLRKIQCAKSGKQSGEHTHEALQDGNVGLDGPLEIGALHLDDHVRSVGQHCAVHLRHRCRSHRFVLETGKQLAERAPGLVFDDPS